MDPSETVTFLWRVVDWITTTEGVVIAILSAGALAALCEFFRKDKQ